jgi:Tol biopolymer transport system component/DNA-binding winged helix-turn-helix (wHTH) protein
MNRPNASLPGSPSDVAPFRLGDRFVEPALHRITGGGASVQVEPRIMHVLACLASRPGQVVSRVQLLDTVWAGAVVNEETLTHVISQLRRLLGDDPRSPRFIDTIHKSGYRLVAPVVFLPVGGAAVETADAGGRSSRRLSLVAGTAAVLVAVVVVVLVLRLRAASPPPPVALDAVPFTSFPGRELCPAISADGTRVAFSWDGETEGRYDLYLKQPGTETTLRLTDTPVDEYYPAWSPDGSTLAFARDEEEGVGIYTMPAIGGTARRVASVPLGILGIDWSPDGELLAFASRDGEAEPLRIHLLELSTGGTRALTSPPAGFQGDSRPAFSPDGRTLAFTRGDRTALQDVFVVPVEGGEPRRVTHSQHHVYGLDWAPDRRSILFASGANQAGNSRLWRVDPRNGLLSWLPVVGQRAIRPSVASAGETLVYEEQDIRSSIFRFRVGEPPGEDEEPSPLIASTRQDYSPQYSPRGAWISFLSNRSGSPQVWICDGEGRNPQVLTQFEGAYLENPCWSWDESRLAFSAAPGSYTAIYVVDLDTREVRRLSTSDRHEKCLGWSRDGEWLYCKSDRGDAWQVWKIRTNGSERVEVMERDVFRLAESTDAGRLLYSRADTSGVWSAGLDGTDERCVVNTPDTVVPCGWREVGSGLYFFSTTETDISLRFLDTSTGENSFIVSSRRFFTINLDVSPDGRAVIYDRLETLGSDLMIVDSFR